MITYLVLQIIILASVRGQSLLQCKSQGSFYDLALQNCATCPILCGKCEDNDSCLDCQPESFLVINQHILLKDQKSKNCQPVCQNGDAADSILKMCIPCQIENCYSCSYEGNQCKKCKKGWFLSENQKNCIKKECSNNKYSYYNALTGQCITNCNDYADRESRQCVNLKKYGKIKILANRYKVLQANINQIFFYKKIDGSQTVITLDDFSVIFYSYPQLIPENQLSFIVSGYQYAVLNDQSIYLIQETSIQKIDLEQISIEAIYSNHLKFKAISFSKSYFYGIYNQNLYAYDYLNEKEQIFLFQDITSIEFNPYRFNETKRILNDLPPEQEKQKRSLQSQISILPEKQEKQKRSLQSSTSPQLVLDSLGCQIVKESSQKLNPFLENINLIPRDFLIESQSNQQQIQYLYQKFQFVQDFFNLNKIILVQLQYQVYEIYFYDISSSVFIQAHFPLGTLMLDTFEFDGKIRFITIKTDYFQGVYQSAVVCVNFTQNDNQTESKYYFEYVVYFNLKVDQLIINISKNRTSLITQDQTLL